MVGWHPPYWVPGQELQITHLVLWADISLVCPVLVNSGMPARIAQIHRIVEAVAEAVRPDARLQHFDPVRLQEHAQHGVVVAGAQVLQAGVGVVTLADPAFAFGGGEAGLGEGGLLAKRFLAGAFGRWAGGIGARMMAVQGVGGAMRQVEGGWGG